MPLQELPLELFQMIIEDFVQDSGIHLAIKARPVSRLFDREILSFIAKLRLLNSRTRASNGLWQQISAEFVSRYILELSPMHTADHNFPVVMNFILNKVHDKDRPPYQCMNALCRVVQTHGGLHRAFDNFFPEYQKAEPAASELVFHALVASLYLANFSWFGDTLSRVTPAEVYSSYFGTPLYAAACIGHLYIARWLLELGADVNQSSLAAGLPIRVAAFRGHEEIVHLLLRPAYRHVKEGPLFEDAVICATRGDNTNILFCLLRHAGAYLSDSVEREIMAIALTTCSPDTVQMLENRERQGAGKRTAPKWLDKTTLILE